MNSLISKKLIFLFTTLLLPLLIGYAIKKRYASTRCRDNLERLLLLNLFICSPILTMLSFWNTAISFVAGWMVLLGAMMQVIPGIAALPIAFKKYQNPLDQGSFILATMFANRSIIGLISVFIIFGETGYALGRLTMILGPFMFYMVGFPLAEYFHHKSLAQEEAVAHPPWYKIMFSWKQLPLIGIAIGIYLNRSGISRPEMFSSVFLVVLHINSWLFLLPVGYDLDFTKMRQYWTKLNDLLFIRFLLVPIAVIVLMYFLPLEKTNRGVVLIMAFTPASVGAVIAAKLHKLNTHITMAAYLLTMLIYLVVIFPILLLILKE